MNAPLLSDHRELIAAYDLGHIEEHSPGLIHWHPNGQKVVKKLRLFLEDIHANHHYQEVSSPMILHRSLWERSGHWEKYQDNMFVAHPPKESLDAAYAIKPMSCPGQIAIYQHARRSYRDLPFRLFEFGHVHRNEPSGALSGWMRLRGFVQDDSHVFADINHIDGVVKDVVAMINQVYAAFGFSQWKWQLSLRPAQRAGSDDLWDRAEQALRHACASANIVPQEMPGEGAFYGPKLEAVVVDRLGRSWQCGVAQIDFVLPQRFDLEFQSAAGHSECPVLIHHAVVGSLERWLSIVMEHLGRLPLWLAPVQVGVFPIAQRHEEYAQEVCVQLKKKHIQAVVMSHGPLNGRMRAAHAQRIPIHMVVGDQEHEHNNVSCRLNGGAPELRKCGEAIAWAQEQCQEPIV